MRLTTANQKNANYGENHEIYVGTHTGSFKRLCVSQENPYAQINLCDLKSLSKDSRVTVLEYGDDECNEILIGRASKTVQSYNLPSDCWGASVDISQAPIVGLARYDDKLIAGCAGGEVEVVQESGNRLLAAGDNISRLRQCPVDKKLVATGGKERQNNLKIFDLERMEKVFSSKNLPNDFLQLEVPIWDSDVGFLAPNVVATCSRYGYVRLYDTRKQRRPVQKYANEEQMSFSCLVARDNFVYAGTTMGALKAFDTRNLKNFVHTYKGFTGGLSNLCLDATGKYLVSASLDRYVRVHHTDSCVLMYQCYVKSKATSVLIKTGTNFQNSSSQGERDERVRPKEIERKDSDEEYDAMFDSMQTVGEASDVPKSAIKQKTKRKNKLSEKISKKKKFSE